MKHRWCSHALVLGLCLATAAHAAAQDTPAAHGEAAEQAEAADESRSQAFQAVDGAVEEDIAGGPLMLAAYAFVWLVVFGYVLRLIGLQRRTLEEIAGLKRAIEAAPAGSADDGAAGGGGGDGGSGDG